MGYSFAVAAGAGVVSALLFASAASGNMLVVPLYCLGPFPIFAIGFVWGARTALFSAVSGSIAAFVMFGGIFSTGYFITLGLPAAILIYLALLARGGTESADGVVSQNGHASVEWYPPGHLVAWSAVMAGALTALTVPLLGFDAETYRVSIQTMLENTLLRDLEARLPEQFDADQLLQLTSFLVRALPAVSSALWLVIMVFNMWAAGRVIDRSGHALRSWPKIEAMSYPQELFFVFAISIVLSLMAGLIGIIATGFAGAFIMAHVFLGLAVIHTLSRGTQMRPVILSGLYMGLVLFGWAVLIVATIGIGEPLFKLRERFAKNNVQIGHDDD